MFPAHTISTTRHRCKLPKEDLVLQCLPGNGCNTRLRRLYHKMLMISSLDPRAKIYCESLASVRSQQINHVTTYPYTIHPMSIFRIVWDCLMIMVDILLLVYLPFNKMFCSYPVEHIRIRCDYATRSIMLILCLLDIFFNFITCYYSNARQLICSYKDIALCYLKGRLIFDFLSTIPNFLTTDIHKFNMVYLVNIYMVFSFCRIIHFISYVRNWIKLFNIDLIVLKLIKLFFCSTISIHYLTCLIVINGIFGIKFNNDGMPTTKNWLSVYGLWNSSTKLIYIRALYKSTCLISGSDELGMMCSESEHYRVSYLMKISIWILSRINLAILMWYLGGILKAILDHKARYRKLLQKVHQFSKCKLLSDRLSKRISIYYKLHYNGVIFREQEIFASISTKMKQDIITSTKIKYLLNINFFKVLPLTVLEAFCFFFKEQIYLTGDVINSGKKTGSLMIIISGTAACYTSTGMEFLHLVDGDFCGELEFIPNNQVFCTVVALEPCKVYCLYLKDFYLTLAAVSQYSELLIQLQLHIENYIEFYNKIENHFTQLINEVEHTHDVFKTGKSDSEHNY